MNFNDKVRALALRLIGNNNAVLAATEPKVYVALLTQTGTDAPVATIIKNTLGGEIFWEYAGVGSYSGTLEGAFTLNKTNLGNSTASQLNTLVEADGSGDNSWQIFRTDADIIEIKTYSDLAITPANGILIGQFTKIEVYP